MSRLFKVATVFAFLLLASQMVPTSVAAGSSTPTQAVGLVLSIIPPKLPADGGSYSAVVVSLIDSNNLPTAALNDLTIFLTSSLVNIVAVPDAITIHAGQEYAIANASTTTTPGSAMITAHSEGLTSPPPQKITTVTPSGYPSKLLVYTSPSTFLPRADTGVVRVEVVDDAGMPSKAITAITVSLSSSNASIASLGQNSLTISSGTITSDGTFSTLNPGVAVITAVSTGYSTGTALVTVNKPNVCQGSCAPYKLSLRLVPGTLPTDGQTYSVLEADLQTSSGAPATASSLTVVQLTSDNPDVASVPNLITIPAGRISSLASVTTSALAGVANVTATAAGLLPATIPVRTIIPAPSNLQAYVAPPSSAFSAAGSYPILVVQLQDSSGNPARARQDTSIIVTSSNGSLFSSYMTLVIPKGNDYVFAFLHTKGVGTSVLTATSQGLTSSTCNLQSLPGPLVIRLILTSTSNSFIYDNQTATFLFSASFVGQPLKDVNVTWSSSGGAIDPAEGSTGTAGFTTALFTPSSPGRFNITASISTPQTGQINAQYASGGGPIGLLVAQSPQKAPPTFVEELLGFWYYIVAAVAVVVVAAVYLFRMRRKKQRAEIEAGFEVV